MSDTQPSEVDEGEIEIERSWLVEEKPAKRGKPGIAPLAPRDESDSLPDIEIMLEDEEDKDGKFASVEPPSGLHEGPPPDLALGKAAQRFTAKSAAKAPPAKPEPPAAQEEPFDIEVEDEEDEPPAKPDPKPD